MRRTFNFPKDVDDYLSKQPNMTQYISELIRQDMKNKKVLTEQDVINIIEQYLKEMNVDLTSKNNSKFDKSILDSITNIINI